MTDREALTNNAGSYGNPAEVTRPAFQLHIQEPFKIGHSLVEGYLAIRNIYKRDYVSVT
jgi:hypothetical protein